MSKALVLREKGSWTNLHVEDRDIPQATESTAVVKVFAAAVNPSDVKNVKGMMPHTTLPRVPGRDYSGVVVAGPAEWVGKEVWGTGGSAGFTSDGSHAQHISVPIESLTLKPQSLNHDQAAACGVGFLTAYQALIKCADLKSGESVLIIGARGAVGSAAAMLAKWKGAKVIGAVRGALPQPDAFVDAWVSTDDLNTFKDAVLSHTNGKGADVAFDTVGGELFTKSLLSLATRGRQICISVPPGQPNATFDLFDFYRRELRLYGLNTLTTSHVEAAEILRALASGFDSGALKAPEVKPHALKDAHRAYEAVASGEKGGKSIIQPWS